MSDPFTSGVRSPCVRICRLDEPGGPCSGCLRTREEIANWSRFTDEERQAVLDDLPCRMRERFAARRRA